MPSAPLSYHTEGLRAFLLEEDGATVCEVIAPGSSPVYPTNAAVARRLCQLVNRPDIRHFANVIAREFMNDYLTPEKFAEHNGIHEEDARLLILVCQRITNSIHPDA